MTRYYNTLLGENPDNLLITIVAPTGMGAYEIKCNAINSVYALIPTQFVLLYTDINKPNNMIES